MQYFMRYRAVISANVTSGKALEEGKHPPTFSPFLSSPLSLYIYICTYFSLSLVGYIVKRRARYTRAASKSARDPLNALIKFIR